MAKRGFFAELNYQAQQAEQRRLQQEAALVQATNAAVREAERRQRVAEQARARAARASEAERKAAEKEAARLHLEAQTAEVDAMNQKLASDYKDIDTLLEWTLGIDDYVDLESLKVTVEHPPFEPGEVGRPIAEVPDLIYSPQPQYVEPPAPKGLSGAFGGKKRHASAIAQARAAHQRASQEWHQAATKQYEEHRQKHAAREKAEAERLQKLAAAEQSYRAECAARERDVAAKNEELTTLINNLAFDVESAIEEYVGIVLSNSVYPEAFPVEHEYTFDLGSRELQLRVNIPRPSSLPSVKEYRYVKAKDQIAATQQPIKAQRDRYASAVHQVAVRSLHEVFEADRAGKIHSIALTVGANHIDPATGTPTYVPLVIAAADRETFNSFNLANVVPSATLQHLGAAVSKAPFDMKPADTSRGVRQRST